MAQTYKILYANHPVLRKKAAPVESVDTEVQTLMEDMTRIMQDKKGLGLAAPQIGVSKRVLVMDMRHIKKDKPNVFAMANPEITWSSEEQEVDKEFCFSIPEMGVPVKRPVEVKVKYLNEYNKTQELHATGLLARCVQHEMDHLEGIATLDYLSPLKRKMAMKKLERLERLERQQDKHSEHAPEL